MTSQIENYLSTIQDLVLPTKYLKKELEAAQKPLIAIIHVDCVLPTLKVLTIL